MTAFLNFKHAWDGLVTVKPESTQMLESLGISGRAGIVLGILSLVIAVSGWTIGTIYSKKHSGKPQYIFLNLFYQFVFSAIVQFGLALIFSGKADVGSWKTESIFAAVYLAIFGSVLGYFCYHYALKKVSASEVSILTYFNTVIAIFLGWLILNEKVDIDLIVATVLIIAGVFITNYKKKAEVG